MTSMELRSKRKALFLALAICITFSVVFTGLLAASILDHDCIGEENGCPFCLQIRMAKIFLKTLHGALLALYLAVRLSFSAHNPLKFTEFALFPYSLVMLKVRFNS